MSLIGGFIPKKVSDVPVGVDTSLSPRASDHQSRMPLPGGVSTALSPVSCANCARLTDPLELTPVHGHGAWCAECLDDARLGGGEA